MAITLGTQVWLNADGVKQLLSRPLPYPLFLLVNTRFPFEVIDSWYDEDGNQYCQLASALYPKGRRPSVGWVAAWEIRQASKESHTNGFLVGAD